MRLLVYWSRARPRSSQLSLGQTREWGSSGGVLVWATLFFWELRAVFNYRAQPARDPDCLASAQYATLLSMSLRDGRRCCRAFSSVRYRCVPLCVDCSVRLHLQSRPLSSQVQTDCCLDRPAPPSAGERSGTNCYRHRFVSLYACWRSVHVVCSYQ